MYQFTKCLPLTTSNFDSAVCNENHDPIEDLQNLNDSDDEFLE
jgi:hypothetical protein